MIVLAAVTVITSIVLTVTVIWLSSSYGERFVLSYAELRLSDLLKQTVSIGSVETNFFTRLVVTDIKIYRDSDSQEHHFLTGRYLRVNYRLWRLLRAELALDSIILKEFDIHVIRDSTGILNTPSVGGSTSGLTDSSSLFHVYVGSVDISNLSTQYMDKTLSFKGILDGVEFSLDNQGHSGYAFSLLTDSIKADYLERNVLIENLDVKGDFQNGLLSVASFNAGKPEFELTGAASFHIDKAPYIKDCTFTISGDVEGLRQVTGGLIPGAFADAKGRYTVSLEVSAPADSIELSGVVELDDFTFRRWNTRHASLDLAYSAKTVSVNNIDAQFMDGTVSGSGRLSVGVEADYLLKLETVGVSIGKILLAATDKRIALDGRISGDIDISGSLSDFFGNIIKTNIQGTELTYDGAPLPDVDLKLSYLNNNLQGTANFNKNILTARGMVTRDSLNVNVDGAFSSLKALAMLLKQDISGEGSARCSIYGPLINPGVSCTVDASNLRYRNIPVEQLTGGFVYDDRGFILQDIHLSASDIPADSLFHALNLDGFGGSVSYSANASGSIVKIRGDAMIEFNQPAYKHIAFDKGSLKAAFSRDEVIFENVSFSSDSLHVSGSGRYGFAEAEGNARVGFESAFRDIAVPSSSDSSNDKIWRNSGIISAQADFSDSTRRTISVTGDSLEVRRIAELFVEGIPVSGTMAFSLNLNGSLDQPDGQMHITVDKPEYGNFIINTLDTDIHLNPDSLWISSLKLISDYGEINGNAGISLHTGNSFISSVDRIEGDIDGSFDDLNLFRQVIREDMVLRGKSTFNVSWNGILGKPLYYGSLNISEGYFGAGEESNAMQNITVNMRFEDNKLLVDSVQGTIKKVPVIITGDILMETVSKAHMNLKGRFGDEGVVNITGLISSGSLDMKLGMEDFNVAIVQPFTTFFNDLDGVANSTISVNGRLSSPVITGGISMRDVRFKTPYFNRPLTNGIIDLSFNNRTVTVDTLTLKSKDGTVEAGGYFIYADGGFEEIDLAASIHDMKIDQPDKYAFMVKKADLAYRNTGDGRYGLKGMVLVEEGTISYNYKPQKIISRNKPSRDLKDKKSSPILTGTDLDIRISNNNPVWIDNMIAHVSINSDIEVTGSLAKPNITGRISAKEGYVVYLDRLFDIARGTLDFVNPTRINPIIDFQAVTNIQQTETFAGEIYVITLNANGELDKASIVINSSPALSKSDIIALLSFGATTDQLTGTQATSAESSTGSIMMERVTELSSRVASNYLTRKVSGLLGIKGLSIGGNLFGWQESNQIDASEKLARELKSDYSTNVGELNNGSIRLRYDISRFFSIEGYTNQTGQGGIDLDYSVTFK